MRIGKEYKHCDVNFGDGLKIGEAFYYRGGLYMKIQHIEYDTSGFHDMERYNAVNLEDGSLTFLDNDDIVVIANVYIEKD